MERNPVWPTHAHADEILIAHEGEKDISCQ